MSARTVLRKFRSPTLVHSAKGSTWEEHKYIKRIDGTYYYPDSYEGGRHLPDGDKKKESSEKDTGDGSFSLEKNLYKKLKGSAGEQLSKDLRFSFDKVLREQYGEEWTKIPQEELDRMQRSLIDRLEGRKETKEESKLELSETDIENLAKEVIEGKYGDGEIRKDIFGENYEEIQNRVNQLLKKSSANTKMSDVPEEVVEEGMKAVAKASSSSTSKGIDMEQILSVYKKQKEREKKGGK